MVYLRRPSSLFIEKFQFDCHNEIFTNRFSDTHRSFNLPEHPQGFSRFKRKVSDMILGVALSLNNLNFHWEEELRQNIRSLSMDTFPPRVKEFMARYIDGISLSLWDL